jgi:hypothetical protein
MMSLFGDPVKAQTVAPGPYYANPSWDQTLACSTLANCPRFIVLSNMNSAAVLDRETGLVWERSPSPGPFVNWLQAHYVCNKLILGNRFGWRLPTVQELASLMEPRILDVPPINWLPAGHPFGNVQLSEEG